MLQKAPQKSSQSTGKLFDDPSLQRHIAKGSKGHPALLVLLRLLILLLRLILLFLY